MFCFWSGINIYNNNNNNNKPISNFRKTYPPTLGVNFTLKNSSDERMTRKPNKSLKYSIYYL